MAKKKYTIGQDVVLVAISCYLNKEPQLTKVTKVGRLYFEVKGSSSKFKIDTGYEKSNYTPDYRIYDSLQAIKEEKEMESIWFELSEEFNHRNISRDKFTLDHLRRIKVIVDEVIVNDKDKAQ